MLLSDFIRNYATDTGQTVCDPNDNPRTVWLVSIAGIMSSMESCDSYEEFDSPNESWHAIFEEKRDDECYADLVDSLTYNGILTPFCILTNDDEDGRAIRAFHNGNHRLAAAVELGYTHVPIVFVGQDESYTLRWELTQLGGYEGGSDWDCGDPDDRYSLLLRATIEPLMAPAPPVQSRQLALAV